MNQKKYHNFFVNNSHFILKNPEFLTDEKVL